MKNIAKDLCPYCTTLSRTHQSPTHGRCTGGRPEGFNNCFDRRQVKRLQKNTDIEILKAVISSNCLSCNNTKASQTVFVDRLQQIIHVLTPRSGECQYCHCTEDNGCLIDVSDFGAIDIENVTVCTWFNSEQTVCTNPRCIDRHKRNKRAEPYRDDFLRGAALVLSELIRSYDCQTIAKSIMRIHGLTRDKMRAGGVPQVDLKAIPKDISV